MSLIDRDFFDTFGYVVVPDAVPADHLTAVVQAVWDFLGMDPGNPDTWYQPPHRYGGMVEMYHHPAMWAVRQHPRVHQAFSELFGTARLWVSLDRVNMKPPARADKPEWDHRGFTHWDWDSRQRPIPFRVQGVLYLTDTTADMGGFQCIRGFHRRLDEWAATQPADRDPRVPDLTGLTVEPIPGRAGDLLIWHVALPHGNGHNTSGRPRLAQYVSMYPAPEVLDAHAAERVRQWRELAPPNGTPFPGDARGWERQHYGPPALTELGERLLGLRSWADA
ncbi:MAG: phytanoyl-CoA dioxygenase family protein [Fimbriimonadaceae bacterium]|nr:phytanoyl-CoA dioxygenase family protein [Fimbriimonadaceae bacterium]